jgi:[glutamine synthetase] adenylyltransferase / [glutamine synthetase]-adenylyl-L-tyrosine phosphorylase
MTLIESIQRVPIAVETARGQALAADWDARGALAEVLTGIGGCSPYLCDLLRQEQDWLVEAVTLAAPLQNLLPSDVSADIGAVLRRAKRRVAGFLAMAEVSGAYSLKQSTQALTDFADQAVSLAFQAALAPYQASGKLPSETGLFVIAMGKMGAGELNYSSDIDLVVMFDDRDMDHFEAAQRRQILVRATRAATKLLNDITEHGYVFRTDLRLRPDPSVTPICVAMSSALDYYESLGRTWERAAFIKARICAGDRRAGAEFLDQMKPFVWRRYLDFAAIEEAHALRLKIRTKTGARGVINVPGHDVKLGRGGIREIEFFTQTRQLISGGRDAELRSCQTLVALDQLAAKDWITEATKNQLQRSYRILRHTEHAIQMIRDAQTQSVPASDAGIGPVAGLLGLSVPEFLTQTGAHLNAVHAITESFFAPAPAHAPEVALDDHHEITQYWPSYAAMRSERATVLFETLRPEILSRLQKAPDPKEALIHFDNFLRGLPAGIQVFSLFAANPKLVELLTDIVVSAPALAQYLGRNSGVLDAVLSGEFFAPWPGREVLAEQLAKRLAAASDYETALDLARIWTKEWHFRIGVHLLEGITAPHEAAGHYAQLAEAVLTAVFDLVHQNFALKYGHIPESDCTILAMGSLGAGQLNSQSDLDMILVFDADATRQSNGAKPLSCRQYFSRLTQALITALTAPTAHGRLYEVDMRLRPSGRAGPVATSLAGFESYQRSEAWTWEHLALTRGRVITGAAAFRETVERLRQQILEEKADWPNILQGLRDMRARLADGKPQLGLWDLKRGSGGLQDIELVAQGMALMQNCPDGATAAQLHSAQHGQTPVIADFDCLARSYDWLSDLRLLHHLICGTDVQSEAIAEGGLARMRRIMQMGPEVDFKQVTTEHRQRCAQVIDQILGQSEGQGNEG